MKRGLRVGGGVFVLCAFSVGVAYAWDVYETTRWESYFQERSGEGPLRVRVLGPIPPEVPESSGLAVSRTYPGIYWTHNDSGDQPRLYALDSTAALVATIDVGEARARDWEDLDIGPCPTGATATEWCLYIADTGDNSRRRETVRVYVVPEPDPRGPDKSVQATSMIRFSYEGGPFDVEALAATPAGDLVLATKGRSPTMWVFQIAADEVARAGATGEWLTLTDPIALAIEPDFGLGRWITGGSLTADGSVLALRTYTEVYFYEWPLAQQPVAAAPTCVLGGLDPIGEAVAFSSDERIYLTSESPGRLVGRLLEIECAGVGADRSGR